MDFVHILEDIVGRRAKVKLVEKGRRMQMHCPEVEKLTQELGLGRGEDTSTVFCANTSLTEADRRVIKASKEKMKCVCR